jgi:hypothetical protein
VVIVCVYHIQSDPNCSDLNAATAYLHEWVDEVVMSVCHMIWVHRGHQKKAGSTADVVDSNLSHAEATALVEESAALPQVHPSLYFCTLPPCSPAHGAMACVVQVTRYLRLMYGAFHVFKYKSSDCPSSLDTLAEVCIVATGWSDALANKSTKHVQISSMLLTYDCQTADRVLYPELVPVSATDLSVDLLQRLPLKRECVVTSGSSLFLVDSHRSLVLYRWELLHEHFPTIELLLSLETEISPHVVVIIPFLVTQHQLGTITVRPRKNQAWQIVEEARKVPRLTPM